MIEVENFLNINKTSDQKMIYPLEDFVSKKIITNESEDDEGYNQFCINVVTLNDELCNIKQISYPQTTTLSPRANDYSKPITTTINLIEDFLPIQDD